MEENHHHMNRPLVSIVIVNFNGRELLEPCLGSVYAQAYHPIEVIVVDNGSTDDSVAYIRRAFPEVRIVENSENLGFAGGNNRGVERAHGEYVALLNNDTVVEREWLVALMDRMQAGKSSIVASKVLTDGITERMYEMNGTVNFLGYNIPEKFSDLSTIFYASAASLLYRRSLVQCPFLD